MIGNSKDEFVRRAVHETIRRRRDVRAEFSGDRVDDETLWRILDAAHCAPSVGNTQPWDFVVIRDSARLHTFASHVAEQRQLFADTLPADRRAIFKPIRIEGVRESGTGIVVTYDPSRGGSNILGRNTIEDTGIFSSVLAVQNIWLAATAENLGVGWVSFYDEDFLLDFVGAQRPARAVAWLCIGPVTRLQDTPDLERMGWRSGRPLTEAVHLDHLGGAIS